jgi:2-enoate reductase
MWLRNWLPETAPRPTPMHSGLGMAPEEAQQIVGRLISSFGTWFQDVGRLEAAKMTSRLHPYDHMFSPITVNRLEIRNRLVMGPMGNVSMADEVGRPTDKMIAYFEDRARGGIGLITSGLVPVSPETDPSLVQSGGHVFLPRINAAPDVARGWRDLAESVHAHGARFFIQLTAGLGRVGSPECVSKRWRLPVSASWNRNFYLPRIPCRPLIDRECRKIIRAAGQAAVDAMACGIDGVYLHGHEGYLLEQFTNPAFNRRRFGRYADWQRFGLDIVEEIRRRCGAEYPIMYRIDLSLALRETYGERMDEVASLQPFRGERTVAMSLAYIRNLIAAGVDIVDVDLGCYENWWLPHPPSPMPPGTFLLVAKLVKSFVDSNAIKSNAGRPVPVVAVGKLGYPDIAEEALRDGLCDMIMLARPLLADPDWPRKAFAGRAKEIVPCIGDQEGCLNEIIRGGHVQCAVNPRTGFEDRLPLVPTPTKAAKRIAVVGAGPAGITCACLAAERGHVAILFEQKDELGGWLRAGSTPAIKFDVANYLRHLENRIQNTAGKHRLEVRLSTQVTPHMLAAGAFDAVVCCTGSIAVTPEIEMAKHAATVVLATELLLAPSLVDAAVNVVVVGGGDVGCETAHMLAYELGKKVTVIEASPDLMQASCAANRGYLIHHLERRGVSLWNCSQVKSIGKGIVEVTRNVSRTVPSPGAVWQPLLPPNVQSAFARDIKNDEKTVTLPADLVVFATGLRSDDTLYRTCVATNVALEIHNIGDACKVGRIFDATKAGYAVGCSL